MNIWTIPRGLILYLDFDAVLCLVVVWDQSAAQAEAKVVFVQLLIYLERILILHGVIGIVDRLFYLRGEAQS